MQQNGTSEAYPKDLSAASWGKGAKGQPQLKPTPANVSVVLLNRFQPLKETSRDYLVLAICEGGRVVFIYDFMHLGERNHVVHVLPQAQETISPVGNNFTGGLSRTSSDHKDRSYVAIAKPEHV